MVHCPECGCSMVQRSAKKSTGSSERVKGSRFFGCQRFPFCFGTIPLDNAERRHDSLTQLLLDAHALAVKTLAQPDMMGKTEAVRWFCNHGHNLPALAELEKLIDIASKEASALGSPRDFIQEVHDERRRKLNGKKYGNTLTRVKDMPMPVFQKRWDQSKLDQIELTLSPIPELIITVGP